MDEDLEKLMESIGGYWGSHPRFPVGDWRAEVENDETRRGYAEWLEAKLVEADGAGDVATNRARQIADQIAASVVESCRTLAHEVSLGYWEGDVAEALAAARAGGVVQDWRSWLSGYLVSCANPTLFGLARSMVTDHCGDDPALTSDVWDELGLLIEALQGTKRVPRGEKRPRDLVLRGDTPQ
jgi:hypothetical protein